MPRRIFFIVGVLIGFLFGEVLRRKRMERLAWFEADKAERTARHKEWEKNWQAHISTLPPEEKIEWAIWEAQMEANNWELEDEDETEE